MNALIMAGGRGTRMGARTDNTPKPMLLVRGKPIIQGVVEQLVAAGIHDITIACRYEAGAIMRYFDNADMQRGCSIEFITEETPMGTAGALSLLPPQLEPLMVINGDIISTTPLDGMIDKHREKKYDITVGVHNYQHRVPYGVIHEDKGLITGIDEKPVLNLAVSAGIYILSPEMVAACPARRIDMPDLIRIAIDQRNRVGFFYLWGQWMSVETPDDLRRANELDW